MTAGYFFRRSHQLVKAKALKKESGPSMVQKAPRISPRDAFSSPINFDNDQLNQINPN